MGGPLGVITGRVAGGPGIGPKFVGGLIWDPLGTPIEGGPVGGGGPMGPGLIPLGTPMGGPPTDGPMGKDETGF